MTVQVLNLLGIDFSDPIFKSVKNDYPSFDTWVDKIRKELNNRIAFGDYDSNGSLTNIAIVKLQDIDGYPKISTFKVASSFTNKGLGSQLMETVIAFLKEQSVHKVFIEFFPKQETLISFVRKYNFELAAINTSGEYRFVKTLL